MGCARPSTSQQWVSESSCRVINPACIFTSPFQVNHPLFDRNWSDFQKALCFVFLEKWLEFFKHVLISTYSNTVLCLAPAVLHNWFCAVSASEWPMFFFFFSFCDARLRCDTLDGSNTCIDDYSWLSFIFDLEAVIKFSLTHRDKAAYL